MRSIHQRITGIVRLIFLAFIAQAFARALEIGREHVPGPGAFLLRFGREFRADVAGSGAVRCEVREYAKGVDSGKESVPHFFERARPRGAVEREPRMLFHHPQGFTCSVVVCVNYEEY